jgi:Holliday junction resolvase RusA-like endonuclease
VSVSLVIPGRARPSVRITGRAKWTKAARAYLEWQKHVASFCAPHKTVPWRAICISYTFYLSNRKHGDLTNLIKSTEDGIQYGKLIENDRYVVESHGRIVYVRAQDEERVEVTVSEAV